MHALRGNDFFYDIYDKPELFKTVLTLITDSIIHYARLKHHLDGQGDIIPEGYGICDDLSAMIPPEMWGDLVVPYIGAILPRPDHRQTQAPTSRTLTAAHLPYLETLELAKFRSVRVAQAHTRPDPRSLPRTVRLAASGLCI